MEERKKDRKKERKKLKPRIILQMEGITSSWRGHEHTAQKNRVDVHEEEEEEG